MKNKYAFIIATLFLLAIIPFALADGVQLGGGIRPDPIVDPSAPVIVDSGTYQELTDIQNMHQVPFFDEKIGRYDPYLIISDNTYSAEWYPDSSPLHNYKKLTVEVQLENDGSRKYYSLVGTADVPKYYNGAFDIDTSNPKLVIFRDGYVPTFTWKVSSTWTPIIENKTEVVTEEFPTTDLLLMEDSVQETTLVSHDEITQVEKKAYTNYSTIANLGAWLTTNINHQVELDPDVSACGTLSTAGATYTLTQNLIGQTSGCFTAGDENITLDCQGFTISGINNTVATGISTNSKNNMTIKNCNIMGFGINILSKNSYYTNIINNTVWVGGNVTVGGESAIYVRNTSRSLIKDNYINSYNVNTDYGIYIWQTSMNNIFDNNQVYIYGSGTSYALYLSQSGDNATNNTFKNNYLFSNSSRSMYINGLGNDNQTIINNTIIGGTYGLRIDISKSNIIINNNITGLGDDGFAIANSLNNNISGNNLISNTGNALYIGTVNSTVINNNNCTSSNGAPLYITGNSKYNNITTNRIIQLGNFNYYGLYITGGGSTDNIFTSNIAYHTAQDGYSGVIDSPNNYFYNNQFYTISSAARAALYFTANAPNSTGSGNIGTCLSGTNCYGEYLNQPKNDYFVNGTFTGLGASGIGLLMVSGYNNTFINSTYVVDSTLVGFGLNLQYAYNDTFTNVIFNNAKIMNTSLAGDIKFYGLNNYLAYYSNGTLYPGTSGTIANNDGNLNVTIDGLTPLVYILDNYAVVQGVTRSGDPITVTSTTTGNKVTAYFTSSLTSSINASISFSTDCSTVGTLIYQSSDGYSQTYTTGSYNCVGGVASLGIIPLGVGSNSLLLSYNAASVNSCSSMVGVFTQYPVLIGLIGTVFLIGLVIMLIFGFTSMKSGTLSPVMVIGGIITIIAIAVLVIIALVILPNLCGVFT